MKSPILIASDLHGNTQRLKDLFEHAKKLSVSTILFAGDFGLSSPDFALQLHQSPVPIISVRGNCDSPWMFEHAGLIIPPLYRLISFEDKNIFLTHGHLAELLDIAVAQLSQGDILITGHTHRSFILFDEKIWHLNPGSATSPRDGKAPTFSLITDKGFELRSIHDGSMIKHVSF